MNGYLLAHDLGTSGNKATLYTTQGQLRASVVQEYPTYYPGPGCIEQDPEQWWEAVCISTQALLEKAQIAPSEILAVSFSGQMMGCALIDGEGNALGNSLIWADTRATKQAERMLKNIDLHAAYRLCGHRISASYPAAKAMWVQEHEPERFSKARKLLQAKDWIVYRLTGNMLTDLSDASGTNLLDLERHTWSSELIEASGLPASLMPDAVPSTHHAGDVTPEAARATGLLAGTPVIMGGGDGCCASVGAGAVEEGRCYNVIGSSSWIATATKQPVYDPDLRTFTFIHLDDSLYSPCGSMQAAGYAYRWAIDALCDAQKAQAKAEGGSVHGILEAMIASSPVGANGILFLPYLLGERSPRWDPQATGAFLGLRVTSTKADMMRAVMEGVGLNLRVILEAISPQPVPLTMIGGGAQGLLWMQILADIYGRELQLLRFDEEATSLGAAICAGVGIGVFKDFTAIHAINPVIQTIQPRAENLDAYRHQSELFERAYQCLAPLYPEMSI